LGPVDSDLGVGASGERSHASTTGMAMLVDALGSSRIDMRSTTAPPAPAEAGGAPDYAVTSGAGGRATGRTAVVRSESTRMGRATGRSEE
jgi:hypothetical protein